MRSNRTISLILLLLMQALLVVVLPSHHHASPSARQFNRLPQDQAPADQQNEPDENHCPICHLIHSISTPLSLKPVNLGLQAVALAPIPDLIAFELVPFRLPPNGRSPPLD